VPEHQGGAVAGADARGLGVPERVEQVQLAVGAEQVAVRADRDDGVVDVRGAAIDALQHAGHDHRAVPARERGQGPGEGPVQRLGDRGERLVRRAEVPGGRLGEDHHLGAGGGRLGGELADLLAVDVGIEAGRELCDRNPHGAPSVRVSCRRRRHSVP
jgi:hypothetical protein